MDNAKTKSDINQSYKKAAKLWIQGKEKVAFEVNGIVYYETVFGAVSIIDKARAEGKANCLSCWNENNMTHYTYNPHMQNAPVQLVRNQDQVSVSAKISFYGNLAKEKFVEIMPHAKVVKLSKNYADIAMEGIRNIWSDETFYADENNKFGDYRTIDVKFNIEVVDNYSSIAHLKMHIKDIGQPICWYNVFWKAGKKSVGRDIVLCAGFRSFKMRKAKHVWEIAFKLQAAHEFGHVLGLGDAYKGLTQHGAPNNSKVLMEVPANEIMRSGWQDAQIYANTMEMILEAFKVSSLQRYDPRNPSAVIRTY